MTKASHHPQSVRLPLAGMLALSVSAMLAGCGGSSGGDGSSSSADDGAELSGTLVGSRADDGGGAGTAATTAVDSGTPATPMTSATDGCDGVPAGYEPLASAKLFALDGDGNELGEFAETDLCGRFSGTPPEGTEQVRAEAAGWLDLITSSTTFDPDSESPVASTIDADAGYAIGVLTPQSDDRLAFTVMDDQTGRSVIGLPEDAFSVEVEGEPADVTQVVNVASTGEAASVAIVLDASGSMATRAYTDEDTGEDFTRFHLARLAAHEFMDSKAGADEHALLVFDHNADLVDDDWTAGLTGRGLDLRDAAGDTASYTFSADGFTADADELRLFVDAFSPYSEVYTDPRDSLWDDDGSTSLPGDTLPEPEMHPVTDDLGLRATAFPWGGDTAVWDAVDAGIDAVAGRDNDRRVVVTMGDGLDNTSSTDLTAVIDRAADTGITMYSVGLGVESPDTDAAAADLRDLGVETGGAYFWVDDADLSGAFTSIQTGIRFQYLASLVEAPASGESVTLSLDYNDVHIERTTTVP